MTDLHQCHVTFNAKEVALKGLVDFTDFVQVLQVQHSETMLDQKSQLRLHHEALFLTKFDSLQKKCCKPLGKSNQNVMTAIRALDIETVDKGCAKIKNKLVHDKKTRSEPLPCLQPALNENLKAVLTSSSQSDEDFTTDEVVNSSSPSIGISPLK